MKFSICSCAPKAISIALGETYDQAYKRVQKHKGNPTSVQGPILHKIIKATGRLIMTAHPREKTPWTTWRMAYTQGLWLVATIAPCAYGSHLICLRDGKAYDNGWGRFEQHCMDVVAAWRLSHEEVR